MNETLPYRSFSLRGPVSVVWSMVLFGLFVLVAVGSPGFVSESGAASCGPGTDIFGESCGAQRDAADWTYVTAGSSGVEEDPHVWLAVDMLRLINLERQVRGIDPLVLGESNWEGLTVRASNSFGDAGVGDHFSIVTQWMNSSGHRRSLMNRNLASISFEVECSSSGINVTGLTWMETLQSSDIVEEPAGPTVSSPADGVGFDCGSAPVSVNEPVPATTTTTTTTTTVPATPTTTSTVPVLPPEPCTPNFDDVAAGTFYFDAVKQAFCDGVTAGKTDTLFAPEDPVTRGQAVTFLHRYTTSQGSVVDGEHSFDDVADGTFYSTPVGWAVEAQITTGITPTRFGPYANVTRYQAVTFLWRLAGEPAPTGTAVFDDVPAGDWYSDAVSWAATTGVTTGTSATTFSGGRNVTRAEFVTFLYRAETAGELDNI